MISDSVWTPKFTGLSTNKTQIFDTRKFKKTQKNMCQRSVESHEYYLEYFEKVEIE